MVFTAYTSAIQKDIKKTKNIYVTQTFMGDKQGTAAKGNAKYSLQ